MMHRKVQMYVGCWWFPSSQPLATSIIWKSLTHTARLTQNIIPQPHEHKRALTHTLTHALTNTRARTRTITLRGWEDQKGSRQKDIKVTDLSNCYLSSKSPSVIVKSPRDGPRAAAPSMVSHVNEQQLQSLSHLHIRFLDISVPDFSPSFAWQSLFTFSVLYWICLLNDQHPLPEQY